MLQLIARGEVAHTLSVFLFLHERNGAHSLYSVERESIESIGSPPDTDKLLQSKKLARSFTPSETSVAPHRFSPCCRIASLIVSYLDAPATEKGLPLKAQEASETPQRVRLKAAKNPSP
jgi:hypothetical protein